LFTRRVTPKGFRSIYISSSSPRLVLARRKDSPALQGNIRTENFLIFTQNT
jgi:hypothetical protein